MILAKRPRRYDENVARGSAATLRLPSGQCGVSSNGAGCVRRVQCTERVPCIGAQDEGRIVHYLQEIVANRVIVDATYRFKNKSIVAYFDNSGAPPFSLPFGPIWAGLGRFFGGCFSAASGSHKPSF